jgi:predicted GH43/DUF377 family glycosyl hydrolase
LTPNGAVASSPGLKIDGVLNCGVTRFKDEILLLCRVAESAPSDGSVARIPLIQKDSGSTVIVSLVKSDHPEYCFEDPRVVTRRGAKSPAVEYLTSLSHLRIARSHDGVSFKLDDKPAVWPVPPYEAFGMEDPRITNIDGCYYINYTASSPAGCATALMKTTDFVSFERLGLIFLPENKDVCIFPQKINGKYYALNRPVPNAIGSPDMWISESPDLVHWGRHQHIHSASNGRVGGGAVPFLTERGWVAIYHWADASDRYCLGAMLLDANDPSEVIAISTTPLLEPVELYETQGYFSNVVFTCGCLYENGIVTIYYGAADDKICRADVAIEDVYALLDA